ncbi:MAG: hypothetical protein K8R31_02665, partial [Bacteroidales bacterium]|nr:hypothetical protein [Bacteroidales bacterium]
LSGDATIVNDGTLTIANDAVTSAKIDDATITNADIANTTIDLAAKVTGTLPIANGGTNNGTLPVTNGGVVYTDGSKLMNTGAGTTGHVLTSNGAGAPTWTNPSSGFTGNTRNQTILVGSSSYAPITGTINPNATDSKGVTRNIVWRSGTIKNLYVIVDGNPGAVNNVITIMINGAPTSVTVTLNNVTNGSDVANSFTVVPGDEIGVKIVTPPVANAVKWSWAVEFTY